jgi:hypothetical protein
MIQEFDLCKMLLQQQNLQFTAVKKIGIPLLEIVGTTPKE